MIYDTSVIGAAAISKALLARNPTDYFSVISC